MNSAPAKSIRPLRRYIKAGFRVPQASLFLPNTDNDYQAVIAYQGFMAYIYLADRSTCPQRRSLQLEEAGAL